MTDLICYQARAARREINHEAIKDQLQRLVFAVDRYLEFPQSLQDPPKTVEVDLVFEVIRAKTLLEQK